MSKSILIVEDEKILRISLADALKAEGYTVLAVDDGSEALAVLAKGNFRWSSPISACRAPAGPTSCAHRLPNPLRPR